MFGVGRSSGGITTGRRTTVLIRRLSWKRRERSIDRAARREVARGLPPLTTIASLLATGPDIASGAATERSTPVRGTNRVPTILAPGRDQRGRSALTFDNAALRLHLTSGPATSDVEWAALNNMAGTTAIAWQDAVASRSLLIPMDAFGPAYAQGARCAVATIRTHHAAFPESQPPVTVTIRAYRTSGRTFDVVGIERSASQPAGRH